MEIPAVRGSKVGGPLGPINQWVPGNKLPRLYTFWPIKNQGQKCCS